MNPLPTISLVTPSFNQAEFIGAMFASVAAQEYPRLQHVVVDGGSSDGTAEVIARHRDRLSWSCSERDRGMYDAINKGFARTDGEIMGWLNSDDLLLPGALRAVGGIFAQFPDIRWISSLSLGTWTPDGRCLGTSTIEGYSTQAMWEGGYLPGGPRQYGWIPQESTFWRRSLWEDAGGRVDDRFHAAGDFELWCRFFQRAELVGTPTPIGGFRVQPKQKSADMQRYLEEARRALAATPPRAKPTAAWLRRISLQARLNSIPGVRRLASAIWGYQATKVVARPEGGWERVAYRFL